MDGARRLREWNARFRWALAHWPRRPEMDAPPDPEATRWMRFRRSGGVSGRIHDAFRRRLSSSGKALCGLWFVALVVSRIPSRSLADVPFAVFSAALVVAWCLSWRRCRLEGRWSLPDDLEVGGTGHAEVVLFNAGRRTIPDPGAGFFRFADGVEFVGDGRHLPPLAPGERAVLRLPFLGRLRGPSPVDPPHVLALEPLGLMRGARRLRGKALVVVKPRRPRLGSFPFLVAGVNGSAFARELGGQSTRQGDPSGVREYRPGDSLRDLHHRSWARRGSPVTRERTNPRGEGIRLVVSTRFANSGERVLVDDLLGLGASIALWLEQQDALGEAWIDGVRIDPGQDGMSARFWRACGDVPRAGWRRGANAAARPVFAGDDKPMVFVGLSDDQSMEAGNRSTKRIILDWGAETTRTEREGRLIRVAPDSLARGEFSL